jgi:hypothetical protein
LYRALQNDDRDMAVAAYESWGFANLSTTTIDILNRWARFLYGPVLDNATRTIGTLDEQGVYGREVAREVHAALRAAGGNIVVPRAFVFMDRAALGLGSVFLRLRAEVNWHRLFNEMINDFDVDALARRQETALRGVGLTAPEE